MAVDDAALPDTVDRAALARLRTVAHLLDEAVRVPGTDFRVGLDPVVSAVPVVGDALTAGLSLYVVLESARLGVSYTTLVRMLANVAVDVAGGSLPVVGWLFDVLWKTNEYNLALLVDDLSAQSRTPDGEADEEVDGGPVVIEVE
jgi:hypothetical protein